MYARLALVTVQQPPETPKSALVDKALAGGLSSIPLVGGVVGAFYQEYMERPYAKRLERWQQELTEVVNELAWKYDTLPDDDVLLDAMINATRVAQATSQQEKIAALRNGVVNSVASDAPDPDEQARFFRLVDQLSVTHLRMLRVVEDPVLSYDTATGAPTPSLSVGGAPLLLGDVFVRTIPELAGRKDRRDLLFDDLASARLVITAASVDTVPVNHENYRMMTDLGRRFLRFIDETG